LPDEIKSWTSTANGKICTAQTLDAVTRTQRAKDTADSQISKKPSSDSLSAPEPLHLAYSIWPERVAKACEKDRSLAIAHGLEHLCKVEPSKAKKKAKSKAAAV